MIEDVIARLLLGEGERDWAKLALIEQTLRNLWDDVSIMAGEQGNPLPVSVADLQEAGAVAAPSIREFLVRGTWRKCGAAVRSSRSETPGADARCCGCSTPRSPRFGSLSEFLNL